MNTQNICNICGANYEYKDGKWRCPACGAYKPEEISNEEETLLYNAAQKLRLSRFDDAEEMYRDIVLQYPKNSRGYWGLVLAKYGIKYEKDYDGKMIPSCYAASYESILDDENYKKALQNADRDNHAYYQEQARRIEAIRHEWVDKADREEPYDIFISYKDSDKENGISRTQDSYDAYELYSKLKEKGYHVFYSRESLAGKEGEKYEPYIFNALNTAHVMIVYGTRPEYIESTWVKNEWMRYYKRIRSGLKQENSLLLAYKGFHPSQLPSPLCDMQGFDFGKITVGIGDLETRIESILSAARMQQKIKRVSVKIRGKRSAEQIRRLDTVAVGKVNAASQKGERERVLTRTIGGKSMKLSVTAEKNLSVAENYLARSQFEEAEERFDEILQSTPRNGRALTGKLLAQVNAQDISALEKNGFKSVPDASLIEKVLVNAEKENAEGVLKALCTEVSRSFERGNISQAKLIVSLVRDYESVAVDKLRGELYERGLLLISNDQESAKYFLDVHLSFEVDEGEYVKKLHTIVNKGIECVAFSLAGYYADKLRESDENSYETQISLLKIEYKTGNEAEVFHCIDRERAYLKIEEVLSKLDAKSAAKWLQACFCEISALLQSGIYAGALRWIEICAKYQFNGRKVLLESLLTICQNSASMRSSECFEAILTYVADGNSSVYAEKAKAFADASLKAKEFDAAKLYYGKVLSVKPDSIPAAQGGFFADIRCSNEKELPATIVNLTDWACFEEVLIVQTDDADDLKWIEKLVAACMENIRRKGQSANESVFNIFEKLLSYIPEASEAALLQFLKGAAELCLQEGLFVQSQKYYEMYISEDADNGTIYWGLLQAKLKCRSEEELIRQSEPIGKLAEFENAQVCAADDKEVLNHYIDVRDRQSKHIKTMKKRKRLIKFGSIALAAVFVVAAALFGWFIYYNGQNQLLYEVVNGGYIVSAGKFYETESRLVIPAERNGKPVIAIGDNAFTGHTEIEEVVLPASIERIGSNAFADCINLTTVTFVAETSVRAVGLQTALHEIGDGAFSGCINLGKFDLPYGVEYIGARTFSATSMAEVTVPNTVKYIGDSAFDGCDDLQTIIVGDREEIPASWAENWKGNCGATVEFRLRVVFDYNGATAENTVTEQYVLFGGEFAFPVPERNGYTFDGWFRGDNRLTDAQGNSMSEWQYENGGTVTAQWAPNVNKLVFNANGGTGDMPAQNIATDASAQLFVNTFTRKGYTFAGWAENATGSVVYADGAEYTMGAESSYELFAVWTANRNEIVFDGNGATGGSMESQFMVTDSSAGLTENTFVKTGYKFVGWAESEDGDAVYIDGAIYAMGAEAQYTLYAVWETVGYTIKYTLNNGMAEENPPVYTIESEDFVLQAPTRAGYRFIGWTGTELSEPTLSVTIKMGSTGNREYTATWEANTNKIVFHANGGEGEMSVQNIRTDEIAPLSSNLFTRSGYTFAGWATSESGRVVYLNGANYTMAAESEYHLYAVWTAIEYSICYILNGGSVQDNPSDYTIESDTFRLKNPVRAGYTFAGWTGTDLEEPSLSVSVVQGSIGNREYMAIWEANINKVIFHANGGEGEMPAQKIKTDASASLSENTFTRLGYTFIGWAANENGEVAFENGANYAMGAASEYHLYAVWTPNLNKVRFEGNGADGGEMGPLSVYTDASEILPENKFTRTGYTFLGWSSESGGGVVYEDGAAYAMGPQSSYTLYAVWKINQYTITIVSNGGTEVSPIVQDYNTVVTEPVVTRSGYAFVEWYKDGGFEEVFNFATMPAENVTVYAKWRMSNLGGELTGIRTAEELMAISGNLAGNYYLENDIDMSGYEWVPVGTKAEPFTGSFDGKNFTVSNLKCNVSAEYYGMFGYTNSTIKNIVLIQANYSGRGLNVGGIAGKGVVENSLWSGNMHLETYNASIDNIGGIVGIGSAYGCRSSGNIYAETGSEGPYIGGIVGQGEEVEKCYSDVDFKINTYDGMTRGFIIGGKIAGRITGNIKNCYSDTTGGVYQKYHASSGGYYESDFEALVAELLGTASYCYGNKIYLNQWGQGDPKVENCIESVSDRDLKSRYYMVGTMGWDESVWCFGYGNPVFYGTEYIRVIYENCEGVNNDENPSAYKIGSDGFTLAIPYRTGYTFGGWYSDDQFKNKITQILPIAEPVTIYALWTPNTYTVTLNPVGGELEEESVQVTFDGSYQLEVPTMYGYVFEGWYNGTGQTAVAYTDEQGNSLAAWTDTEGLTLYAKWQRVRFTVTLQYEGATSGDETQEIIVWTGNEYELPVPARENYVFAGWYSALGGGGTKYADEEGKGTEAWSYADDVTLYAYWLGTDGLAYTLGEDDTYSLTGLTDTSLTEAYIPEYFYGKPVTKIAANAFASGKNITGIVVPASIQTVEKGAFAGCTALQTLTLPFVGNSRTAEGEAALLGWLFSDTQVDGCTLVYQYYSEYGMTAAYIPVSLVEIIITDAQNIGYGAFSSITSLQSVSITAKVLGDRVFYDCASLTDIELCDGMTAIGQSAFARCVALQEVIIPNSVQSMGRYAFDECAALTSLTIPFVGANMQASGTEGALGYLFGNVSSADMVLVNQNMAGVKAYFPAKLNKLTITNAKQIATGALYGLKMLKDISFNDEIISIGNYALSECTGITNLSLPVSLQTIGNNAFFNVKISVLELPERVNELAPYSLYGTSLRTLLIPSEKMVTLGVNALVDTHSALKIYVHDKFVQNYKSIWKDYEARIYSINCILENGMAIYGNTFLQYFGNDTDIALPANVTEIGTYAFAGTNVRSVLVPGNIRTIGANAFSGCDTLESVRMLSGVRTISANAFYGAAGLLDVEIPNTVAEIGASAFYGCASLTEVVVPNSVMSIGEGAFQGCNALTKMTLPFVGGSRSVTDITPKLSSSRWNGGSPYLFGYIFGGEIKNQRSSIISSSKELIYQGEAPYTYKVPDGNTYEDRYCFNLYYIPSSLREIIITDAMGISANAFYNCTMLTSITLSEGLEAIYDSAFYNCDGLTEIVIPGSVTSIGTYTFAESGNLSKVTLPSGLTKISDYMFRNCISLTSVNGDNEVNIGAKVTSIGNYAFDGCVSIAKVTLPNELEKIGNNAFSGATGLTQINIPENVTSIGVQAFDGCTNLVRINSETNGKIVLYEGLSSVGSYVFRGLDKITEVIIPNSVMSIGLGAFEGCNALTKMTLPFVGGTREISSTVAATSSVFSGSKYLFGYIFGGENYETTSRGSSNSVIYDGTTPVGTIYQGGLSYVNYYWSGNVKRYRHYVNIYYIPSSLREIVITDATGLSANAFYNCTMLTSITLNEGLEKIYDSAFYNCDGLTEMVIPRSVTNIGKYAFAGCSMLQTVQVLREDVVKFTSLGTNAFDATHVALLILVPDDAYSAYIAAANWSSYADKIRPASASEDGFIIENGVLLRYVGAIETITIPVSVTSIGEYAFAFNQYVKTIVVGDAVVTIGNYAFYNCSSLQNVVIGNGVQSIGSYAFYGCAALQSVMYGDRLQSIGDYAFTGCGSLSMMNSESANTAVLDKNLAKIGQYAFQNCGLLKTITVEKSVTGIGVGAFIGCNSLESITLPFIGADSNATAGYSQVFGYIFGYTKSNTAGTVEQVSGYYYYIPASIKNVVITQETELVKNAFTGCANIISIELDAVQSIADYAFYGCNGLVSLTICSQNMPLLSGDAFNGGKIVTVYVPDDLVEQYQADEQWKKYTIAAIF